MFVMAAAIISCSSVFAEPIAYYVDEGRPDDSGDGLTWATAKKTIQAAVDLSESSSYGYVQVIVTNGIYDAVTRVTPGYSSLNRLVITKDVLVRSVNGPQSTFIQGTWSSSTNTMGTNAVRCVFMSAGTLSGFSIINGYARYSGSQTYDQSGGGVNMYNGSGVLTNCILEANVARYGGGSYNGTLNNCILFDNAAEFGGACAGGVLNNCVLHRNRARKIYGGSSTVECSTGGSSGGILNNCTIFNNSSRDTIGGCSYSTLRNCIIWGNSPDNCSNCTVSYSCTANPEVAGTGNITNNPQFVDSANRDYHLMSGSACINAGNNVYAPLPYDLDGKHRIFAGTVDIGAYEWISSISGNDYDGDLVSDLAVLDQGTGRWFIRTVGGTQLGFSVNWGWPGVEGVAGDYDGDGKADLAVFDQGTGRWFIESVDGTQIVWENFWGWPGVRPVAGDYDGDGINDLAILDQGTGRWFIKKTDDTVLGWSENWGWAGVVPVAGDYDGDGKADLAVFDQNTGRWFIRTLDGTDSVTDINWGWPGVEPVPGDYDGDGKADLAVFDQATGRWFIRSVDGSQLGFNINWGWPGVHPVSGDFDGDGADDLAIVDEATGRWFIRNLGGTTIAWDVNWGWPGVQPIGK